MNVFSSQQLDQATAWLQKGHLLAYPTEAVWGIGCDPFNRPAVSALLALKDRPIEKGLIVLTPSADYITAFLTDLSAAHREQILASWHTAAEHTTPTNTQIANPQATTQRQANTWLLPIPKAIDIPDWLTGGRDSLAVRVIAPHTTIAKLCAHIATTNPANPYGFLVSTSCNPSGGKPATLLAEAQAYFGDAIGYLDAPTLGYTQPSQIRDAVTGALVRL